MQTRTRATGLARRQQHWLDTPTSLIRFFPASQHLLAWACLGSFKHSNTGVNDFFLHPQSNSTLSEIEILTVSNFRIGQCQADPPPTVGNFSQWCRTSLSRMTSGCKTALPTNCLQSVFNTHSAAGHARGHRGFDRGLMAAVRAVAGTTFALPSSSYLEMPIPTSTCRRKQQTW